MVDDRYAQRLSDFGNALERLKEGLEEAKTDLGRDGVIQRFEFTYEQAWKTIRLWLAQKDIDVRSAKDALRAGLEQGLISDGNLWSRLHEGRNLTSHTYDRATADEIFNLIKTSGYPALKDLYDQFVGH